MEGGGEGGVGGGGKGRDVGVGSGGSQVCALAGRRHATSELPVRTR